MVWSFLLDLIIYAKLQAKKVETKYLFSTRNKPVLVLTIIIHVVETAITTDHFVKTIWVALNQGD